MIQFSRINFFKRFFNLASSWPRFIFKCLIFLFVTAQLISIIIRQALVDNEHYPLLIGAYCYKQTSSSNIQSNENIDDQFNIQQCSFRNIDACQQIFDRSLLFRLHDVAGFTSELNNLIRAFMFAIDTRRRFLVDDQLWNYGSFSSYFNVSQGHFSPWLPSSIYCQQRKFVHLIEYDVNKTPAPKHLTVSRGSDAGFTDLNPKIEPLENHNDTLQMKRIVAQYLWKTINQQTQDLINEEIKKINLKSLTFGLHIRRGDKLISEAGDISLEKYINGVDYFLSKSRENVLKPRVFVASDEQNIIEKLRNLRTDWEFVQISQRNLFSNGHQQTIFNHLSENNRTELTRCLMAELEILSKVKYVICTFSSNICRFVQTLRKEKPETVLSLDMDWFPK